MDPPKRPHLEPPPEDEESTIQRDVFMGAEENQDLHLPVLQGPLTTPSTLLATGSEAMLVEIVNPPDGHLLPSFQRYGAEEGEGEEGVAEVQQGTQDKESGEGGQTQGSAPPPPPSTATGGTDAESGVQEDAPQPPPPAATREAATQMGLEEARKFGWLEVREGGQAHGGSPPPPAGGAGRAAGEGGQAPGGVPPPPPPAVGAGRAAAGEGGHAPGGSPPPPVGGVGLAAAGEGGQAPGGVPPPPPPAVGAGQAAAGEGGQAPGGSPPPHHDGGDDDEQEEDEEEEQDDEAGGIQVWADQFRLSGKAFRFCWKDEAPAYWLRRCTNKMEELPGLSAALEPMRWNDVMLDFVKVEGTTRQEKHFLVRMQSLNLLLSFRLKAVFPDFCTLALNAEKRDHLLFNKEDLLEGRSQGAKPVVVRVLATPSAAGNIEYTIQPNPTRRSFDPEKQRLILLHHFALCLPSEVSFLFSV